MPWLETEPMFERQKFITASRHARRIRIGAHASCSLGSALDDPSSSCPQ
jgi:hypothetical protein